MTLSHAYISIGVHELPVEDLRGQAEGASDARAFRMLVLTDHGQRVGPLAYMVHLPTVGRTGIAWREETHWAESTGDLTVDVDTFLNHHSEGELAN